MKKSAFVLAMLGAITGAAHAQSSVTLFGVVDLAARNVKNGSAGTQQQLNAGGLNTGRLGFRGVEDLGGGLFAGFHLESTVGPDLGTGGNVGAGKFFDRRSTVSLTHPMGELRLGRDYNPTFWNTAIFDPFGAVGLGTVLNFTATPSYPLGSGATTALRNDNSIGYLLPRMGGLYGQAMVAAGEGTPGNKYVGARLGYAAGPLDAAVSFGRTETGVNDFDQSNIGASYNFGSFKVMGLYHQAKFGARKQKTALIGGTATFGQGEVRASYIANDRSGGAAGTGFANGDDSKLMALGYVHNLSKRTALYGTVARITNDGAARASVSGAPPAGLLGGQTSSGFEMGISHRF